MMKVLYCLYNYFQITVCIGPSDYEDSGLDSATVTSEFEQGIAFEINYLYVHNRGTTTADGDPATRHFSTTTKFCGRINNFTK